MKNVKRVRSTFLFKKRPSRWGRGRGQRDRKRSPELRLAESSAPPGLTGLWLSWDLSWALCPLRRALKAAALQILRSTSILTDGLRTCIWTRDPCPAMDGWMDRWTDGRTSRMIRLIDWLIDVCVRDTARSLIRQVQVPSCIPWFLFPWFIWSKKSSSVRQHTFTTSLPGFHFNPLRHRGNTFFDVTLTGQWSSPSGCAVPRSSSPWDRYFASF